MIGTLFFIAGIVFIFFGIIGLFRFDNFYSRALVSSKIDTVGYLSILIGVILKSGWTFLSMKIILILLVTLLVNPLTTHIITRSAYINGLKTRKDSK